MSRILSRLVFVFVFVFVLVPMIGCRQQPAGTPSRPVPPRVSDGYGEEAKDQAGGVSSVTFADGNKKVSRVEELLEGLPGLDVKRAGNGYSVTMRGVGSFMSSEQVLFVIDGTPYAGALGWLNPADVMRIDLLKNPSETSIYGVRGGNGVVVITTRRKPRRDSQ